jgi:GT2 family glycosyltransferase
MSGTPISICTAVWNGLDFSLENKPDLKPNELVIVDNGSDSQVSDYLRQHASKYFRFETNQGFCKGFNKALELCSYEHVLLTNNDTQWPQENWKKTLLDDFNSQKGCGLLFPVTNNIGCPANLRKAKGRRVFALNKWERFMCSGVAIFSTKRLLSHLGGFDESFGTSGEDLDLQCKAWEAGYEVCVTEKVFVKHIGKATSRFLENREVLWKNNTAKFRKRWEGKLREKPKPFWESIFEKVSHSLKVRHG